MRAGRSLSCKSVTVTVLQEEWHLSKAQCAEGQENPQDKATKAGVVHDQAELQNYSVPVTPANRLSSLLLNKIR